MLQEVLSEAILNADPTDWRPLRRFYASEHEISFWRQYLRIEATILELVTYDSHSYGWICTNVNASSQKTRALRSRHLVERGHALV